MTAEALKIVVVDDDDATCELVEVLAAGDGHDVASFTDGAAALDHVRCRAADVLITDLTMPELSGLDLIAAMRRQAPGVPVVVLSGHTGLDDVVNAIRAGAQDFLMKPLDADALRRMLERVTQQGRLDSEIRRLRQELDDSTRPAGFIGASQAMREVFDVIGRVAPTDASVLISGESGTGKELVARSIHESSGRGGPFVAVNCAAIPSQLLESELFGHTQGAFTDAASASQGLFVEANEGTLFLDEVTELPIEVQPKLLRALQERTVRPVGGDEERRFSARLISATNRDPEAAVSRGRLREDSFFRLQVVQIELPPLRARGTDAIKLARHFLARLCERYGRRIEGFSPEVREKLLSYPWPGNVRELENALDRAVALTSHDEISLDDLPPAVREHRPDSVVLEVDDGEQLPTFRELETRYLNRVLRLVGGNKSEASRVLGVDRRTLYRKMARLGVEAPQ